MFSWACLLIISEGGVGLKDQERELAKWIKKAGKKGIDPLGVRGLEIDSCPK
jgi:hypothetical protein